MPPAAFGMLWETLKAGKPWMGIVKNRCKTGDHYWVDAYITRLRQNGQIYGYESVRVKADPEVIKRAEVVYERINQGKAPYSALEKYWSLFGNAAIITIASWILLSLASGLFSAFSTGNSLINLVIGLVLGG